MQVRQKDKNSYSSPEQILRSLARELKNPLVFIARQAELTANNPKQDANPALIQDVSERALKLIDSYLLVAQSEYGQQSLPLQTVGIGSVIYEVATEIKQFSKSKNAGVYTSVKDASVTANRESLKALLWCLSEMAVACTDKKIYITAKKDKEIISIAVAGDDFKITKKDIDLSRRMQGVSSLASGKLPESGIRLAIADILAGSLGSELEPKRVNKLSGLGFNLTLSKQLTLV